MTDLLIGYHLVARLGFSGSLAGTILFATFALSALPDVFIASWLANRPKPTSTALKLQAVFGIAAMISAMILLGPTPDQYGWKILYVCVISIVFRFTYAAFDVAQNALISLLPRNRTEIRWYVANKTFSSSLGRLASSFFVFLALGAPNDPFADMRAIGFVILPSLIGVLGLSRVDPGPAAEHQIAQKFDWKLLPFAQLSMPMIATAFEVGLLGLVGRLLPLSGNDRPGFADGASLVVAMVFGTVAGPWLSHTRNAEVGRRSFIVVALALGATTTGVALLFPLGETMSLGLAFTYGAAMSALTNLIWERVALIAADTAAATGMRIDAPAFALVTTSIKLAIALCSGLFGIVVDGFRQDSSSSIATIAIIVMIGGFGSALALSSYGERLTGRVMRLEALPRPFSPRPRVKDE